MIENQPAVWDIDQTHPQYHDDLIEGLSGLLDQELGLSFIELGLIRNIKLEHDKVQVTMVLTTPFCPYGPAMLEMTRVKAEQALELPTTIEMGMEMWEPSMMEEGAGAEWGLF